jgi:hypothetical protein
MATNTEGIFVGHPRRGQIGVAVLLAGTITTIPQAIFMLATGLFLSPLFIFGVLHPLTLLCGLWAGLAWPGRHYKGLVALGSLAGLLDLAINWSIRQLYLSLYSSWPQISSWFSWGPIERLDYLSIIGIAALFTAGGLFADLIESRRFPRRRARVPPEPVPPEPVPPGPPRPPSGRNGRTPITPLIQAVGPSLLALIGLIISIISGAR